MQITDKIWAKLSAYLDGELSGRELEQLRKNLETDPQLQSALEQLRTTKQILRATPPIPPPRNFTLTPEILRERPKKTVSSGFRLAAVVLSFVLVGVLVLDFSRFLVIGAMAPSAPRYEEVALEALPESAADAVDEPALMVAKEAESDQMQAELEEQPLVEAAAPVEREVTAEEPAAEGITGEDIELGAVEKTTSVAENLTEEKEEDTMGDQISPSLTPEPQPTMGPHALDENYYAPQREFNIPYFRVIEILLGIGVVGFGLAAWILRRKTKR